MLLFLHEVVSFVGHDLKFENDPNSNDIRHRVNRTVNHYVKTVVDMNHGIKENNILKVLLPLGIEITKLDKTWLSVMESFGSTRGRFAHSSSLSVQTSIDRNTELNRIKDHILPKLSNIDLLVKRLK